MLTSVLLDAADLRRDVRVTVEIPTTLHPIGDVHYPAVIGNISRYGVLLRSTVKVAVADRISITLPLIGTAFAQVVWAHDGRIGCRLDESIRADLYDAMLRA